MIRNQKQLVEYENGDRVIWNGRAEIHYHKTKVMRITALHHAKDEEIERLKKNPHDADLLAEIAKRK